MGSRTARRAQAAGVLAGLTVAALLTVQLSLAAFTDTAVNPGNTFTAGNVLISESRAGAAMFNATNIYPGWSEVQSVTVTNDSTVSTEVVLYVSDLQDTGLAGFLQVDVTRDGTPLYSGTLDSLPQTFATGTAIAEAPATVSVYEFTVSMPAGQPGEDAAQGTGAIAELTWEARSV